MEIETIEINYDEQWDKYWASLDCRFLRPHKHKDSVMECFFEVDGKFSFGDEYKVGDVLKFRYQEDDCLNWTKEDPRLVVMRKFFGIEVLPNKFGDGLFVVIN